MNYLNLEIADLNSEKVKGSDPVERGTWLMLQSYCAEQENGGRIEGAKLWKCRKWQQLAAVTLKEVMRDCDLWEWEGDDLIVWGYPAEQEEAVRKKRETGAKGGRPRKPPANHMDNHMVSEKETISEPDGETERKGKERKEKECTPNPPQGELELVGEEERPKAERVLPDRWKNIPKIDLPNHRVLRNNRLMIRIGKWFNRREGTRWNLLEATTLMKIQPDPEDVDTLEAWYLASDVGDRDIRRRDLMTLLRNWSIDLDRARIFAAEKQ